MGTKVQWALRDSGHREALNTMDREEKILKDIGLRGTEKQWAQRDNGHRGTLGPEGQWTQRRIRLRGTIDTYEQYPRLLG